MSSQKIEQKKSISLKDVFKKQKNHKFSSSRQSSVSSSQLSCMNEPRTERKQRLSVPKKGSETSAANYRVEPSSCLPKIHDIKENSRNTAAAKQKLSSLSLTSGTKSDNEPFEMVQTSSDDSSSTVGGCFMWNRIKSDELTANFVGPSRCLSSFEVAPTDVTYNENMEDKTHLTEDKALKNWERWMTIRRQDNKRFARKLQREKCKLIMNTTENLRQVREEKDMLAYAQISQKKKWEEGANCWKERPKLPQSGLVDCYYAQETSLEKGIIPPLEFVDVPNVIRKEKDVFCKEPHKSRWISSEYLKQRKEQLARQLQKMQPQPTDLKKLVVIGEKICRAEEMKRPVSVNIPIIQITPPEDLTEDGEAESEQENASSFRCPKALAPNPFCQRESVAALRINGVHIIHSTRNKLRSSTEDGNSHTWSLVFDTKPCGSLTEKALDIENTGTAAIRYGWQYTSPDTGKTNFPPRKLDAAVRFFFFDKNPGIFLPGQKYRIIFYHFSETSGYHSETWQLKLVPNLFGGSGLGIVRLTAVADERNTIEDLLKIDSYLESRVRDTVVRKIVSEIFEAARTPIPSDIEYRSLFMEDELFDFQNRSHFYRYDFVQELKTMYQKISADDSQEWDLNLFTLEERIRERVEGETQREMLGRLMELSRLLLRPGCYHSETDMKKKMLHKAMCRIMDVMGENALRIKAAIFGVCESEETALRGEGYYESDSNALVSSFPLEPPQASLDAVKKPIPNSAEFFVEDVLFYRHVLHTMMFNYLCEAAELTAGIIESCRLFQHHGEVFNSNNFLEDTYNPV